VIQFASKNKPRIVEPHDYGIHKGEIKLFGYQVGGQSSEPLPNWRWSLVNLISDLGYCPRALPAGAPLSPANIINGIRLSSEWSRRQWAPVAAQRCGSSSSSLVTEWPATRASTSANQANGSTFTSSQEVTKLRSTAAVRPPRSLPKKVQLLRLCARVHNRKNWLHLGSVPAGPKIAAIASVVESCRRLGLPVVEYLMDVLPGLADRPVSQVAQLTPARWAAARPRR
jgi:hypothetical protein